MTHESPGAAVPKPQTMGSTEWVLLLVLAGLWGGTFYFYKLLGEELPSFTVVLGRVGIAALALLAIVYLSGQRMPLAPRAWSAFLVMGLLNNIVPFSLIVWGETRIASGVAAILNATTPLFTVLLAHLFTRDERLSGRKVAGALFGLCGVVVLIGPSATHGLQLQSVAQLAVLVAALSYGFAGIYGRRFAGQPPLITAAGQVSASALVMIPLTLLVDRPWTLAAPSAGGWAALIALALPCTAVAFVLYFRILAAAGAVNLLLVTLLVPIGALLLGAAFLGEPLTHGGLLGMLLIFIGLAAIDGRIMAYLGGLRRIPRQAE
ncbi:MAG: DMT family transporter [bacterium]|nr:DMT family transporter [bacterium]